MPKRTACTACEMQGSKPKKAVGVRIVYDPAIQMPGSPTIEGHRLAAEMMARRVWLFGMKSELDNYKLEREELLVACWWMGIFGPRRKWVTGEWKSWATLAGSHLWSGCVAIPDPPQVKP